MTNKSLFADWPAVDASRGGRDFGLSQPIVGDVHLWYCTLYGCTAVVHSGWDDGAVCAQNTARNRQLDRFVLWRRTNSSSRIEERQIGKNKKVQNLGESIFIFIQS